MGIGRSESPSKGWAFGEEPLKELSPDFHPKDFTFEHPQGTSPSKSFDISASANRAAERGRATC
jgi:hypothetical protein